MWNTFTAGLQMVQEKLDNVLDDSQTQKVIARNITSAKTDQKTQFVCFTQKG